MANTLIQFANALCFPGANVTYDADETAFIDMGIFYKQITIANTILANGSIGFPGDVLTSSGAGVYWAPANGSGGNTGTGNVAGDYAYITSNNATTSSLSQMVADSFTASAFKTVKYLVQIVANNGDIHSTEIIANHNGSATFMTEYATVYSNVSLGNIVSDISGGDFRLLVTPTVSNNTIKTFRTTINS